jgi:hypothetical protein
MVRDIREFSDPEAYADELRRRWGGLLSYRYIGRHDGGMNVDDDDNTVALRHDMRNSLGGIMFAPLAITCPEGGVGNDLVAIPNPVIHSCLILDDARDVRRIAFTSESLKIGQRMGFSRSTIVDADNPDRVIAFTEGQGVSLGTPPPGLERMEVEPIVVVDSPDLPALWKVFGASRRESGHWILPELVAELASPDAALHIGPQHVVLETAATELAVERSGTDQLQVESSHVMFLARGKVGPFRVDGKAASAESGKVGVRLLIHDEGNDDRAITSGTVVFRRAD